MWGAEASQSWPRSGTARQERVDVGAEPDEVRGGQIGEDEHGTAIIRVPDHGADAHEAEAVPRRELHRHHVARGEALARDHAPADSREIPGASLDDEVAPLDAHGQLDLHALRPPAEVPRGHEWREALRHLGGQAPEIHRDALAITPYDPRRHLDLARPMRQGDAKRSEEHV